MAEYTRWAAAQYPNKRLVVHFMQPHFPFLTDETEFDKGHLESDDDVFHMWMQLMTGQLELTAAELRALFADNLRRALPAVERAIDLLDGRTVVTSDHGNMHGERSWPIPVRVWGHPPGIYHPALVEVPWLISEGEDRRRIVAEPPVSDPTDGTDTDVGDRLRCLGYAE